jgi:hypothetical protein
MRAATAALDESAEWLAYAFIDLVQQYVNVTLPCCTPFAMDFPRVACSAKIGDPGN